MKSTHWLLTALALTCCGGCNSAPAPARTTPETAPQNVDPPAAFPSLLEAHILSEDGWSFIDPAGKVYTTDHFRLFTTEKAGMVLERLPAFIENSLARYSTAWARLPSPPHPIDTYFLATRPQWTRMTQALMGAESESLLRIQRGGFAHKGKGIFFNIGPRDTFALMAHEGWHQYTQTTFQLPLPIYFEEGIATTMEGFKWDNQHPDRPLFLPWANLERFEMLRAANLRGLMPLSMLLNVTPQDELAASQDSALKYYAQVWALTLFVAEGEGGKYRPAFERLIKDCCDSSAFARLAAKAGSRNTQMLFVRRRGIEFVTCYFNPDLAAFEAEYRNFVNAITAVGAKEKIVQGLSPAN